MIRHIIFDWSGTLVDDLPAVWKATNGVFARAGVAAISLEQFRAEFCLPFDSFYARYTAHVAKDTLEQWFHEHFRSVQDEVEALPHARNLLEACRRHEVGLYLLSAVHEDHFARQARRARMDIFFERRYLGARDKRKVIHRLIEENRLDPRATLFVGDMPHDIETARHGGVHSCAVLGGYTPLEPLRAAGPDLIVEHLGELLALLDEHNWRMPEKGQGRTVNGRPVPIVTVGALVFNGCGEVLMIRTHKWSNLWGIPGGKIEYGERAGDALRREIREETGLEIADVRPVLVQDCIRSKEFYRDAHFVLLNYTCISASGMDVRLNAEAQEYRWVSTSEALRMELNTPTRILLEDVLRSDSSNHARH